MSDHTDMNEREIERLLAGHDLPEGSESADLGAFFADFRRAYPEASTESCEAAHFAAMSEAAHLLAENGDPAARPASKANGPAVQVSGLPKWRRALVEKWMSMKLGTRIAAGAVALVFAFTGVAIAGGLPDPVQHAVSNAAASVGISIPDPQEELDGVEAPETELESDEADDLLEDADDQGENESADEADDADESAEDAEDAQHESADEADDTDDESADEADDSHDESVDESEDVHDGSTGGTESDD